MADIEARSIAKQKPADDASPEMQDRPYRECTPVPFRFMNSGLLHGEIRRRIRDFRDHGVYGEEELRKVI